MNKLPEFIEPPQPEGEKNPPADTAEQQATDRNKSAVYTDLFSRRD
ncbi:hypothetical protein OG921_03045 [Aldersonia sp. NBC_00410]|nr:hypothetical protein [Aldersonia sp. NBC_00410]MCX5042168.1 hypothetical protein [Aldersonia sp. NBC_00410]